MPNHRPASPARSNQSAIVVVPFAQVPHAAFFDARLHPLDVRLLGALLFFALDSDRCTPSDGRLAELLSVSADTIRRSMANLEACGYIRREKAPWTPANRTGRVIVLVWRTDPSVLPAVPERYSVHLAEGTAPERAATPRRTRNPRPPAPVPEVPPAPVRVVGGQNEAPTPGTGAGGPPAPVLEVPPAPVPDKEEGSGEAFENCLSSSSYQANEGESYRDRDRILTDTEIDAETYRFEAWLAVHDCIGMTDRAEAWLDELIGQFGWETVRAAGLETRRRMDGPSPPRHVVRFLEATAKTMAADGGAFGQPVPKDKADRFRLPTSKELEERLVNARETRREYESYRAEKRRKAQEPA